jgi:hypothetical protein
MDLAIPATGDWSGLGSVADRRRQLSMVMQTRQCIGYWSRSTSNVRSGVLT